MFNLGGHYTFVINVAGLQVNFSVHLQSLASKNFSTGKLVRPLANELSKRLGDLDDSTL